MTTKSNTGHLNGWEQWGKYVVKELERLNDRYEGLEKQLDGIDDRLAKMERVAWLLGGLVALFTPVFIWAVIRFLQSVIS